MATSAKTKTPLQSSNFWTGLATIIGIIMALFHISPDAQLVQQGAESVTQVVSAVESKNWLTLLGLLATGNLINMVTKIWNYFKNQA